MSNKTPTVYMGIDQYGNTYHNMIHPRKELLEKIGASKADKMYVDGADGNTYHCGYIIACCWITLYIVTPFRKKVTSEQEIGNN